MLQGTGVQQNFKFNWERWQKDISEALDASKVSNDGPSFNKVTVDQVTTMTAEQLNEYFSYVASSVDRKSRYS